MTVDTTQESENAFSVSAQSLSVDIIAKLPEIVDELEQNIMPSWENLQKKQLNVDVTQFGSQVRDFGRNHHIHTLEEYGLKLLDYLDVFDVAKIRDTISQFPDIANSLKNLQTKS